MVRSYCVKTEEADRFFKWAARQNFFGRWMPESREVYRAYLGEFFWAPSISADYDSEGWETDGKTPWLQGYQRRIPLGEGLR